MHGTTSGEHVAFTDHLAHETASSTDYLSELVGLLSANQLTISVIESVTGGGIARKLVEWPGASDFFLGGVVAYHPRLKITYGHVLPKTMATHGVVSHAVTEEMAAGIKKQTQSHISIASNGVAGPPNGTYSSDQTGTLFLSWNIHDRIIKTKRFKVEGGRNDVIDNAIYIALSLCSRYIKNDLRKEI